MFPGKKLVAIQIHDLREFLKTQKVGVDEWTIDPWQHVSVDARLDQLSWIYKCTVCYFHREVPGLKRHIVPMPAGRALRRRDRSGQHRNVWRLERGERFLFLLSLVFLHVALDGLDFIWILL